MVRNVQTVPHDTILVLQNAVDVNKLLVSLEYTALGRHQ
jgi:hypothetical protein